MRAIGRFDWLIRRVVSVFAWTLSCAAGGCAPAKQPESPAPAPNIILIVSDDQAPDTIGALGKPEVRTPHLDALVREGVFFSRAYVPLPQCAPSRAAMLTGLDPHRNGVMTNVNATLRPDARTLARVLRDRGYACGMVGKWHLGNEHEPQAGFDEYWVTFPMPGDYLDPELWIDGRKARQSGYLTDLLTEHAIRFIDRQSEQESPFFLYLAYKAPHPPYVGSPHEQDRYDPDRLALAASLADDLSGKPRFQQESPMHQWYRSSSTADIRKWLALYYSMISCMDRNVGRLVSRLRELRIDDRTVIVFLSDNGVMHGEHQMLRKGAVFYEEVVRTPLILWCPPRFPAGTRIDALVSSVDLFPTLCGLAGASPPDDLAGYDLGRLLRNKTDTLHDSLLLQYQHKQDTEGDVPMRGLVTPRYKYVRYLEDGEELYDLREDPAEMKNLIGHADHRQLASELRKALADIRARTGDHP